MDLVNLLTPTICERFDLYKRGDYHRIIIGDSFCNGRYEVLQKLGFGGFATVWLAGDTYQSRFVALKVMTADASKTSNELRILQKLAEHDSEHNHLVTLLNSFEIEASNGLVLPFLGLSLSSPQPNDTLIKIRPDHISKLAQQLAQGIGRIHDRDICCGGNHYLTLNTIIQTNVVTDLSTSNILLQLSSVDDMSPEDIFDLLGPPEEFDTQLHLGSVGEHRPRVIYGPLSSRKLKAELLCPQITIIDMGDACDLYEVEGLQKFNFNLGYAAPEFHFRGQRSKASDI